MVCGKVASPINEKNILNYTEFPVPNISMTPCRQEWWYTMTIQPSWRTAFDAQESSRSPVRSSGTSFDLVSGIVDSYCMPNVVSQLMYCCISSFQLRVVILFEKIF